MLQGLSERVSHDGHEPYTPEYRRGAARLVIDTGRTIAAVAREIGVGTQLLGRWVHAEQARTGGGAQAPLLHG